MIKQQMLYSIIFTLIIGLFLTITACSTTTTGTITGSGELETRELDHTGFTKIETKSFLRESTPFEISITYAESHSVDVTMDDNLFEHLDVTKKSDALLVGLKTGTRYSDADIRFDITMPELDEIDINGASSVMIGGFSTTVPLRATVSGASDVGVEDTAVGHVTLDVSGASVFSGTIEMGDGDFDVSGASSVRLSGSGSDIVIRATDASRIRLEDFHIINADITLEGASSGTVNVSGELNAVLRSASHLEYTGNTTLGETDISGASSISQK